MHFDFTLTYYSRSCWLVAKYENYKRDATLLLCSSAVILNRNPLRTFISHFNISICHKMQTGIIMTLFLATRKRRPYELLRFCWFINEVTRNLNINQQFA